MENKMNKEKVNPPQILVVDDDDYIREMTREALENEGFKVIDARNGKDAITMFKKLNPDIILMDVEMPGMNGIDAVKEIRKISGGESVPIMMVTGVQDTESIQRAYDAGATDFINKPVSWIVLTQRVRYMLRASRAFRKLIISHTRLINAQKLAGVGGWELDPKTRKFRLSSQASSICGFSNTETIVPLNRFMLAIHPDDRTTLKRLLLQAIILGKPFTVDHRIILSDGSERNVFQKVQILSKNKDSQLIGTLQDITERKMSERLEKDRNKVLEMIITNQPMQDVLDYLIYTVKTQKPFSECVISFICDNRLYVKAASQLPEAIINMMNGRSIDSKIGCCGICVYVGETVFVSNIELNPICENFREVLLSHQIQSCYASPIVSGKGQVLGAVTIFNRKVYQPNDKDLNLLQSICKLASITVEQYKLSQELEHQAKFDSLTGLPNRASATEFLEQVISKASATNQKAAILFIDIDRFKNVNDSLGHHIGDLLLKQIAERFSSCTRDSDILARMGGDEFIHILDHVEDKNGALKVAQRISKAMEAPFIVENHTLYLHASIGISIYPDDGLDPITLQKNADAAMYYAKNLGGNRTHWFTPEIKAAAVEKLELENELRKALERGDFELYYQPQYSLKNFELSGFEALIRWNHPENGRISPSKFIPIAEESGLIIPIGTWVLNEACRQNKNWQVKGYGYFRVAVNVSVVQFMRDDFVEVVKQALDNSGLDPKWLEIEITESIVINDLKSISKRLIELQKLGIAIAIDDFGTGYSSMSYLHRLPINSLKIDQSFVKELNSESNNPLRIRSMIKTIIDLARSLNLNIIAEGVENIDQYKFLAEMGCEMGQGFYFNIPKPATELEFDKSITSC